MPVRLSLLVFETISISDSSTFLPKHYVSPVKTDRLIILCTFVPSRTKGKLHLRRTWNRAKCGKFKFFKLLFVKLRVRANVRSFKITEAHLSPTHFTIEWILDYMQQNPSNSIDSVFVGRRGKVSRNEPFAFSLAGYPRRKHFACPGCRAKLFIDSVIFNSCVSSFFFSCVCSSCSVCIEVSGILIAEDVACDKTIGPR